MAVANFFIKKSAEEGRTLTPMRLLKLVYIAHGWHLGLTRQPLIAETVEAWRYGPVIPVLYRKFRDYRDQPIPASAVDAGAVLKNRERVVPFLESVWKAYAKYSAIQLSTLTHLPDTPWYKVWHEQGGKNELGAEIPADLIQEYYAQKATHAG